MCCALMKVFRKVVYYCRILKKLSKPFPKFVNRQYFPSFVVSYHIQVLLTLYIIQYNSEIHYFRHNGGKVHQSSPGGNRVKRGTVRFIVWAITYAQVLRFYLHIKLFASNNRKVSIFLWKCNVRCTTQTVETLVFTAISKYLLFTTREE